MQKADRKTENKAEQRSKNQTGEGRVTLKVIEVFIISKSDTAKKRISQIKKKTQNYKYTKHYYNKTAQARQNFTESETNRMSNNTTKTEMVVEMKSSYKEENAGEGRSLRSRRVNYTINEKTAIKKKIKSCREVPLEIKMEKGNNLRIFCSTTAFENRKVIIETVASNYVLEKTENRHFRESCNRNNQN